MVYTGHFVVQSAWPKIQLVSAGALLFFNTRGGMRGREGAGISGQFGCVLCNHKIGISYIVKSDPMR